MPDGDDGPRGGAATAYSAPTASPHHALSFSRRQAAGSACKNAAEDGVPAPKHGSDRLGGIHGQGSPSSADLEIEQEQEIQLSQDEREAMLRTLAEYPDLSQSEATMLVHTFRTFLQPTDEDAAATEESVEFDSLRMMVSDLVDFSDACYFLYLDQERLVPESVVQILHQRGKTEHPSVLSPLDYLKSKSGVMQEASFLNRQKITEDTPLTFNQVAYVFRQAIPGQAPIFSHPRFPFDPESQTKQTWDACIMLLLLYTTFSVPYALAFGGNATHIQHEVTAQGVFDLVIDALFLIDVVLNFLTAYTARGVYVTNLSMIAYHYLTTWFLLDICGSVPFDKIFTWISSAEPGEQSDGTNDVLKALRMIRILKLVRAVRFLIKLNELEQKDTTGTLKGIVSVFRAVFLMVFVAHLLACFFYMNIPEQLENNVPVESTWIGAYDPELLDFEKSDNTKRYVAAFYWAVITISTVGYGDILPVTHDERVTNCIAALIGGIVFAFCLGILQQLKFSAAGSEKVFEEKLAQVKQYLNFRVNDREFARRVLSYFGTSWREGGAMFDENRIVMQDLPPDLRRQLLCIIGNDAKKTLTLFKGLDDEMLGHVFMSLEPHFFDTGNVIYKARDKGEEMYFMIKGEAQLDLLQSRVIADGLSQTLRAKSAWQRFEEAHQMKSTQHGELDCDWLADERIVKAGDVFGEVCLFEYLCKYRHETAKALSYIQCLVLRKSALSHLAECAPAFCDMLRELCRLRCCLCGISNELFETILLPLHNRSSRAYGRLNEMITQHKSVLMHRHERAMTKGLRNQRHSSISPRSPSSIRASVLEHSDTDLDAHDHASGVPHRSKAAHRRGLTTSSSSSFSVWVKNAPPYLHGKASSFDEWTHACVVITDDGEVLSIFDTVDSLIDHGPICLGRLMLNRKMADDHEDAWCKVGKLQGQPFLLASRTRSCTITLLTSDRPQELILGMKMEDAQRFKTVVRETMNLLGSDVPTGLDVYMNESRSPKSTQTKKFVKNVNGTARQYARDFPPSNFHTSGLEQKVDDLYEEMQATAAEFLELKSHLFPELQEVHVRAQRLCPFAQRPESVALSLIRFKGCHADAFMRFL